MKDKIQNLLEEVTHLVAPKTDEELEALRLKYLSKKGLINQLMADFKSVPAEEKREIGKALNELKDKVASRIEAFKAEMDASKHSEELQNIDLSRTAYPLPLGTRHPLSLVKEQIIDIFSRLGFNVAEGPEIEDDWHVFESLNFPADHPARDMQDTFFISHSPQILLSLIHISEPTRLL